MNNNSHIPATLDEFLRDSKPELCKWCECVATNDLGTRYSACQKHVVLTVTYK